VEKPPSLEHLRVTIRNATALGELERDRASLVTDALERYRMVGSSSPMQELLNKGSSTRNLIPYVKKYTKICNNVVRCVLFYP
jgi:DNA-binding NtrC family response regulator